MRRSKLVRQWENDTIRAGEAVMAETRCAICCLVRDCRKSLDRNLRLIEKLRSLFAESFVIFVENDSTDGTKELVESLKGTGGQIFVDTFDTGEITLPKKMVSGVNPSYSEHRVQKMANYRNRYLDILKEKVGLSNVDWVMIIDPDVNFISLEGIKNSFGVSSRWDVAHANGRIKNGFMNNDYFDVYAFAEYEDYTPCSEGLMALRRSRMQGVRRGQPLMAVRSGFNALAIYRAEALQGVRYRCEYNQDDRVEVLCEHLPLHDDIRKAGYTRQVLNPSMIVRYNTRSQALVAWMKKLVKNYVVR